MKRIFYIIILLILSNNLLGQANIQEPPDKPVHIQFFSGISYLAKPNNMLFMNNGIHVIPNKTSLVLGIENYLYYSNRKYDWPGIGDYHYQRTIDVLSLSMGVVILKMRRLNPYLGLIVNNSFSFGKLRTDNEQIKSNLVNSYEYRTNNLNFLFKLNYRLKDQLSIYFSINFISLTKNQPASIVSAGLAFNTYSRR